MNNCYRPSQTELILSPGSTEEEAVRGLPHFFVFERPGCFASGKPLSKLFHSSGEIIV